MAVEVRHDGGIERYQLPLGIGWDDEIAQALPQQMALARVRRGRRTGFLTDAFSLPSFIHELLALLKAGATVDSTGGQVEFRPTAAFDDVQIQPEDPVRWLSAEQSNSSVIIDHKVMLKLFRRLAPGRHPEAEMSRLLTDRGFRNAPALLGEIVHVPDEGEEEVMAVVQAFIPGEGDAWEWTAAYLGRVIDEMLREDVDLASQLAIYEAFSRSLGQRLGEMHVVLAQPSDDPAFAPETADAAQVERWRERIRGRVEAACTHLEKAAPTLPPEEQAMAERIVARRADILGLVDRLCRAGQGSLLHRVHGDFHLGQVLVASGDVMIIDFEGEPAQPLSERRAKDSGWRDVAGILRSLDYAIAAGARTVAASGPAGRYEMLAQAFSAVMPAALLAGYREATADGSIAEVKEEGAELLDLFMIEKAAYEVNYEVGNRPDWLAVPLRGLTDLLERLLPEGERHE